jgi:hypothetical protein
MKKAEQSETTKLRSKLSALYDRLDNLGDLRDRGYPVPMNEIMTVKDQIRLLESCI